MLESILVATILRRLRALPQSHFFKLHGDAHLAGYPDLIGVLAGRTVALEVKLPGRDATPLQAAVLRRLAAAGALTGVVHSWEETEIVLGEGGYDVHS